VKKKTPLISIVIPTKNGGKTIKNCLSAIFNQSVKNNIELIVIDSGSTDDTVEIINQFPVRLYHIKPEDFNHGDTRNYGVSLAQGEFIVMTVQDAIATDAYWLEKMLKHFNDPKVMAVGGQQVVPHHKDKNPHAWYRPVSKPKTEKFSFKSIEDFKKLSPKEKRSVCGLDDVNAMYRKSALKEIPFKRIAYGEDMLWAKDTYEKGYSIVFDMNSKVEHYHYEHFAYTYKLTLTDLYFNFKHFNYLKIKKPSIKKFLLIIYRNFKYKSNVEWILHNWKIHLAKQKAYKDFAKALKKNEIDQLFNEKIKTIPIGQQNDQY